jgi:tetratricopeptide (TPR) repeat protein
MEMLMLFEGVDLSPSVMQNFVHAKQAMEEALEKPNNQAAAQQYNRAMKQLRNALREYLQKNPDVVFPPEELGDEESSDTEELTEDLEQQISEAKAQLIERFQQQFQERMTIMYQVIEEVMGSMSPDDTLKAQNAVMKVEAKLLRIQERLELGQYDEAMDELEETIEELDEDLSSLEDDLAAQMFRTMNKLQAKILKMDEKHQGKGLLEDTIGELKNSFNNRNKDKDNGANGQSNGNGNGKGNKPDKPDKGGK